MQIWTWIWMDMARAIDTDGKPDGDPEQVSTGHAHILRRQAAE